jgi:C-terminal processing protease CtpA/Prc
MRHTFLCVAAALCCSSALAAEPTLQEILGVLAKHGIGFDTNAVNRAAAEALLKAVDPQARIAPVGVDVSDPSTAMVERADAWAEGLCHLRLTGLNTEVASNVVKQVRDWATERKSGLILDIRDAGGRDLGAVDAIAGLFLSKPGPLYAVKDRRGRSTEEHASKAMGLTNSLPLMLLVNGGTRDAGEVLAAVLKNRPGVMLIGTRTRGDAGIRTTLPLSGSNALSIATHRVCLAQGTDYDGSGVEPEIVVQNGARTGPTHDSSPVQFRDKPLSEKAKRDRDLMCSVAGDACLSRATDILLGLKALDEHGAESRGPEAE